MRHYIIRFFKKVTGDQGQVRELCQGVVELDASSEVAAETSAKQAFCAQHLTRDWSLHADRIETRPAEFPS
jgi:hypothetical protein